MVYWLSCLLPEGRLDFIAIFSSIQDFPVELPGLLPGTTLFTDDFITVRLSSYGQFDLHNYRKKINLIS
jgi:hypothetical protein